MFDGRIRQKSPGSHRRRNQTWEMKHMTDTEIETSPQLPGTRLQFGRYASQGAVVGPISFTIAWLMLGTLQPATMTEYGIIGGLSGTVTNPISSLGVGPNAGLFNFAFVACGLLTLVGVWGVFYAAQTTPPTARRNLCAALLALSPLGLALAGIFTLANSLALHNLAAFLVFVVPIMAFPITASYYRRLAHLRRFGNLLLAAGPAAFVLLALFLSTFHISSIVAGAGVAGLTERLLLAEIQAWYVALGWQGFRLRASPALMRCPEVRIAHSRTSA
jgi:hypothetical membrane protein